MFGNPVHAATGAKLLDGSDDTDFALPARVPLEWVRRYNSMDTRDGLFGPGWSVPVSVQLRINQEGDHPNLFIDQQAREIPFDALDAGQSQWNIAEGWRLAVHAGRQLHRRRAGRLAARIRPRRTNIRTRWRCRTHRRRHRQLHRPTLQRHRTIARTGRLRRSAIPLRIRCRPPATGLDAIVLHAGETGNNPRALRLR